MDARPVTVLGAGSWGTALALQLASESRPVRLWTRTPVHAGQMRDARENERYLPGFRFPDAIRVEDSIEAAVLDAEMIVLAIPSHGMRPTLRAARAAVDGLSVAPACVIASKGVEVDSLATMVEVVQAELPAVDGRIAVMGGPSFAVEVAAQRPCAVVVASEQTRIAEAVQQRLSGDGFRVYGSTDVIGVELGGALKNVIAIAAGITDGMNLGLNARAGLITRGLAEISRLAVALGARPETLAGLAGVGDLILTCTGGLSRNRKVGLALGEGKSLAEILSVTGMVAEGVKNTKSAYQLAQREGVEMPIVEVVHSVLYEDLSVADAVRTLMARELKSEQW
jgi:glycerol-3-phosphate dehydrogenase (NAD(P)+)